MVGMNIFRLAGDILHLLSKCILIFAIHRNRSAEGVSLITQVLYAVVFCTRYLDIFVKQRLYNLLFKIFYIVSSFYIIAIMRWVFPRSREMELAWKMGAVIIAGSLVLSPFGMLIFERAHSWSFTTWLWDFSEILESIAVLPQLLLLRQTTVPTVIDSFYLVALGSYRFFYILNWIYRAIDPSDHAPNGLSVTFGIIQTLLYVDFAWVYWTRQRVKLRNGGIVDADDIRQGWLLRRIFGKRFDHVSDDEERASVLGGDHGSLSVGDDEPGIGSHGNGRTAGRSGSKWSARGISISADDTTLEHERLFEAERSDGHHNLDASVDPDAKMRDPDELARALEEEGDDESGDDDEDGAPPPARRNRGEASGVRNDEWRD